MRQRSSLVVFAVFAVFVLPLVGGNPHDLLRPVGRAPAHTGLRPSDLLLLGLLIGGPLELGLGLGTLGLRHHLVSCRLAESRLLEVSSKGRTSSYPYTGPP